MKTHTMAGMLSLVYISACQALPDAAPCHETRGADKFKIHVMDGLVRVPEHILEECDYHVNITQDGFVCADIAADLAEMSELWDNVEVPDSVRFDAESIFGVEPE